MAKRHMRSDGGAGLRCKPGHGCAASTPADAADAAALERVKAASPPTAAALKPKRERRAAAPKSAIATESARRCMICRCGAERPCDLGAGRSCAWMDVETPETGDVCSACSELIELAEERIREAGGKVAEDLAQQLYEDIEMPCIPKTFEAASLPDGRLMTAIREARFRVNGADISWAVNAVLGFLERANEPETDFQIARGAHVPEALIGEVLTGLHRDGKVVEIPAVRTKTKTGSSSTPVTWALVTPADAAPESDLPAPKCPATYRPTAPGTVLNGAPCIHYQGHVGSHRCEREGESAMWDTCADCGEQLTRANSSKLLSGVFVHLGCPKRAAVSSAPFVASEIEALDVLAPPCLGAGGCSADPGVPCAFATPEPARWVHGCRFDAHPFAERAGLKRQGIEDRIRACVDSQAALPGSPPVPSIEAVVRTLTIPGDCTAPELRERIDAMLERGELVKLTGAAGAPASVYLRRAAGSPPVVMGRVGVRETPTLEECIASGERATVTDPPASPSCEKCDPTGGGCDCGARKPGGGAPSNATPTGPGDYDERRDGVPRIGQAEGGPNDLLGRPMDARHEIDQGLAEHAPPPARGAEREALLETARKARDNEQPIEFRVSVETFDRLTKTNDLTLVPAGPGFDELEAELADVGDPDPTPEELLEAELRALEEGAAGALRAYRKLRGSPSELAELRADLAAAIRYQERETALLKAASEELELSRQAHEITKRERAALKDEMYTKLAEREVEHGFTRLARDAAQAERDAARADRDLALEEKARAEQCADEERDLRQTVGARAMALRTAVARIAAERIGIDPAVIAATEDAALVAEIDRAMVALMERPKTGETPERAEVLRRAIAGACEALTGRKNTGRGASDTELCGELTNALDDAARRASITKAHAYLEAIDQLGGDSTIADFENADEEQAWQALFRHVQRLEDEARDQVRFAILRALGRNPDPSGDPAKLEGDLNAAIAAMVGWQSTPPPRRPRMRVPSIVTDSDAPAAPPAPTSTVRDLF